MSDCLQLHGLQHAWSPYLLPSPRVCSDSHPLSWWCHPTISFSVALPPPAPSLSQHQGLFQWVGSSHQVAKVLELQHSPSNEYLGLISFRIYCFDLPAVQGILKSLQHHILKSSIIWHSAFFMVQLTHPYMITRKAIVLTRWTFVGKVISLLFNMLSRFVIAFLPKNKHLLISLRQSLSAVILEPKKIKSSTISIFPHLLAMKWWDWMPWS